MIECSELENNVTLNEITDVYKAYERECAKRPDYISFVTGQAEGYFAYDLIARAIFQQTHPNIEPSKICFLRYPEKKLPRTITELFNRFPIKEDYDTASSAVQKSLISASPSLRENEQNESAFAIFCANDRDQELEQHTADLFKTEKIARRFFEEKMQEMLKEFPKSNKGGIVTHIFLPKSSTIDKVVYLAEAFGQRVDRDVLQFFLSYPQNDDEAPQIRFLAGAALEQDGIEMVRYTFLSLEQLNEAANRIQQVVKAIFQENEADLARLKKAQPSEETLLGYVEHYDSQNALQCAQEMQECPEYLWQKIIELLIYEEEFTFAQELIQSKLQKKDKQLTQLGLLILDHGHLDKFNEILYEVKDPGLKNLLLIMRAAHYPSYSPPELSFEASQEIEELMHLIDSSL